MHDTIQINSLRSQHGAGWIRALLTVRSGDVLFTLGKVWHGGAISEAAEDRWNPLMCCCVWRVLHALHVFISCPLW